MLETLFQLWPKPINSLVLIKCFGTILFYCIFFIIIIITKKIKTNIKSVSGEKCFDTMQLQHRGANTCTLFITVTIICLCDSCNTSQMPQTFFSTGDECDLHDFQKKQCFLLQQLKPMCASVLISSSSFLYHHTGPVPMDDLQRALANILCCFQHEVSHCTDVSSHINQILCVVSAC